ncbi:hypothetical protein BJF78_21935 [Pseudonocardia sp. CNS-139]|nr:hypothetical protein BJF78_21935 [Pseudonocardia sp. CNS-139]
MTGVVTVADLLRRHAPAPVRSDEADDATQAISVGTLLRREGRSPHALDRPIQPGAHQQAPAEPAARPQQAPQKSEKKPDADRTAFVRKAPSRPAASSPRARCSARRC